ncbi:MAG TPA: cation:proton antiporter, partial [Candidatus Baltobacteraceae bacterium]|nr:cation:proton antiporter [Candidatus Baltobacteraceae bacterium]
MNHAQHNPALLVEIGAVFVLLAALASRALLKRFGIPSIITLLAFGVAAGPSGFRLLHIDLTEPATRALLQLAVVVVLFEATIRLDLRGVSKRIIAILVAVGTVLTLVVLPPIVLAYHFSHLIAAMLAAICIVTGPTVIGPLMARIRPRWVLSRVLESEGLVLDALGVMIVSVVFATYTSRPGTPLDATWQITQRLGTGVLVGLAWGVIGRFVLAWTARASSDLSKVGVLLVGFGAYATADFAAHESGLVAVVACGLLLDFRGLPHESVVRNFKEDLSMLALSVVFVLLASQIDVRQLGPLLAPAAAIAAALVGIRIVSVALATIGSGFSLAERFLVSSIFPRGIVAVSLATYYATQIPAWGLHGGSQLAGIVFLTVLLTIATSTPLAMFVAARLHLQMPGIAIGGITPLTLDSARHY